VAELTEQEKEAAKLRALQRRKKDAQETIEQREYLRHEIEARQHVQDLETIALMLFSGKEATSDPVTGEVVMVPLDKDRTSQLQAAANVKQGLLKKVLPDIKAVELTGAGGEDLGTDKAMAELELRNRLRAILTGQSVPVVIEGKVDSAADKVAEEVPACLQ
jgi:hypothetical protein